MQKICRELDVALDVLTRKTRAVQRLSSILSSYLSSPRSSYKASYISDSCSKARLSLILRMLNCVSLHGSIWSKHLIVLTVCECGLRSLVINFWRDYWYNVWCVLDDVRHRVIAFRCIWCVYDKHWLCTSNNMRLLLLLLLFLISVFVFFHTVYSVQPIHNCLHYGL